jgi:hypothetical protein
VRKRRKLAILGESAAISQEEVKSEEVQPMAAKSSSGGPNIIGNKEALPGSTSAIADPNQTSQFKFGHSTYAQQQPTDETMYNPITPKRTNAQEY